MFLTQDEINTIPFFDIQLPREIALIIFSYLDVKDLCTCALVSIFHLLISMFIFAAF